MNNLNLLWASASLCVAIQSAHAEERLINFNIPAQPVASALDALSAQADLQMLFNRELLKNRTTAGIVGALTAQQALQKLLAGSGLTYQFTAKDAVAIKSADTGSQAPATLAPVNVVGSAINDAQDPYNQDYALPNTSVGTKTDTPIMETPLNVQVISKQVLKDQQIINIGDALKNVSGVTMATSGNGNTSASGSNQSIFLRGFASDTFFRNGLRLQQGNGQAPTRDMEMANVEAVEVLKGPAAILYGQVEPGGMVNVITKQPLATPYYALNQQFGSYDLYRTSIDATGPLTEHKELLYRINASYQNSDSFREFAKKEDFFIAPVLKWQISPQTQAGLEFEYNHRTLGLDTRFVPLLDGKIVNMPRSRNYGEYSPATTETFYGGFNWSHQFNDDWSIKHSFAINQQRDHQPRNIFANTPPDNANVYRYLSAFQSQANIYSTNLDLTGHFDTAGLHHTLLIGGDYYRLDTQLSQALAIDFSPTFVNLSAIDRLNPVHPGAAFSSPLSHFISQTNQIDQYGLYAQDQIELPYGFQVMGGIRYQYLHQASKTEFGQIVGGGGNDSAQTADEVTPRVGILWRAQNWLSLYANYVESFGANTGNVYPGTPTPPTSAEQYEGGIKTEFFDGRLRATLAYYDLTKTNVATPDPDVINHPGFSVTTGAVRSRGPELDITGELMPGWNVIATYANTDARIIKSNYGGFQAEGARMWNVPRNSGSLWSTYELQNGTFKGFKLGGGITLRDGQIACCDAPAARVPGYASVDLLAGYSLTVGKAKITTQVNINNLLNKHYFTGLGTQNVGLAGFQQGNADFGTPRNVMGSINIQY